MPQKMSAGRDAGGPRRPEPADVAHMEKAILLKVDDTIRRYFAARVAVDVKQPQHQPLFVK